MWKQSVISLMHKSNNVNVSEISNLISKLMKSQNLRSSFDFVINMDNSTKNEHICIKCPARYFIQDQTFLSSILTYPNFVGQILSVIKENVVERRNSGLSTA